MISQEWERLGQYMGPVRGLTSGFRCLDVIARFKGKNY